MICFSTSPAGATTPSWSCPWTAAPSPRRLASDGSGGRLQISTSGGDCPRWSPDGSRVYYLDEYVIGQPVMMAVDLTFENGRARASLPQELFRTETAGFFLWHWFDVLPDGTGFVGMKPQQTGEERDLRRLQLVLNWFEELER